jgi:hypothetical protein
VQGSVALNILCVGIRAKFYQCLNILQLKTDCSEMKCCGAFLIGMIHINAHTLGEIMYANYAVVSLSGQVIDSLSSKSVLFAVRLILSNKSVYDEFISSCCCQMDSLAAQVGISITCHFCFALIIICEVCS